MNDLLNSTKLAFDKATIRAWALKQLEIRGHECWRQNFMPVRGRTFIGKVGAFDISGISNAPYGRRLECEVKTVGDRIRTEQKEFAKMIKERGGICLLATEENGKLVIKEFPTT